MQIVLWWCCNIQWGKHRNYESLSAVMNTFAAATPQHDAAVWFQLKRVSRYQHPWHFVTLESQFSICISFSLSVHSPPCALSPPMGPHYLDVPYRSDRRPYIGRSSIPPAQENETPGTDIAALPGGVTPTHYQRWSNPGDSSPAWGTIQHTCRRPLTEYRVYSHDFATSHGKEWEGKQQQAAAQDDSLKREHKPQIPPKVPRSITDVDLSEPNVSFCWWRCVFQSLVSPRKRSEYALGHFLMVKFYCIMHIYIVQCLVQLQLQAQGR